MDPHYHLTRINSTVSAGKCPICNEICAPHDLRIERTLADVISTYSSVRKTLLDLVEGTSDVYNNDIPIKKSSMPINAKANYIDLVDDDDEKKHPIVLTKISFMQTKNLNVKAMKECLLNLVTKIMKANYKINVDGDKEALERRYRELIHLHNAQIGSDAPLTVNQIVSEINKREKARSEELFKSKSSLKKIETLKNGNIGEFKDDWNRLIKKIKDNKLKCDKAADDINEYSWDKWRVVMSDKVGKPFFYNTVTNVGQFEVPKELESSNVNVSQDDNKYPVLSSTLVCEVDDDDNDSNDNNAISGSSKKTENDTYQSNYTQLLNSTMVNTADDIEHDDEMSFEKSGTSEDLEFDNHKSNTWSCSTCTFVNGNSNSYYSTKTIMLTLLYIDISRSTCDICQNKKDLNPTPRRSNRGSTAKETITTMLNGKRSQNTNSNKNNNTKKPKKK